MKQYKVPRSIAVAIVDNFLFVDAIGTPQGDMYTYSISEEVLAGEGTG